MNGNFFAARTHPLIVLASLTSLILGEKKQQMFFMITLQSSRVRKKILLNIKQLWTLNFHLLVKLGFDFELVLELWKVCQEPEERKTVYFYPKPSSGSGGSQHLGINMILLEGELQEHTPYWHRESHSGLDYQWALR